MIDKDYQFLKEYPIGLKEIEEIEEDNFVVVSHTDKDVDEKLSNMEF